MRFLPIAFVFLLGCGQKSETIIPPEPTYFLLIPESKDTWAEHIEKGFLAGCKQLKMECSVSRYGDISAKQLAEKAVEMGDPLKAPICIAFDKPEKIRETADRLSLEDRDLITIGTDDSVAYRAGHVGPDAKKLAAQVATRSQAMDPPAKRILYLLGRSPIDWEMLEASAFRESDQWEKYRPRTKTVSEVTEQDFSWCDVAVTLGEDAMEKAVASDVERIIPTDPSQLSLDLLKSGRAPIVITNNYFDIGLRASRIARERYITGDIKTPILAIEPKEVDAESVQYYLDTRFRVPEIQRSQPAKPKSNANK